MLLITTNCRGSCNDAVFGPCDTSTLWQVLKLSWYVLQQHLVAYWHKQPAASLWWHGVCNVCCCENKSIIFSVYDFLKVSESGSGNRCKNGWSRIYCVRFEVLTVVQSCGKLMPCKVVSSTWWCAGGALGLCWVKELKKWLLDLEGVSFNRWQMSTSDWKVNGWH